ncbi:carbohydrate ABC transporter substrate-binding protein, CUT1 family [Thermus arciformis]|uniref:Carbohydrate ABC transporter substrate-binding protein, CUT1 family n=1 Tax=Thermus arciformis TaxID=482827 RepID=A0A1G7KDG1_9DEIN|nr:ABC transporter substrate-binding protein [Thermus arciformis]SDF35195.1 carbohydrate ABC transporter substrate-binding protein, CUT1 family [Thermus arciformis]
MRGLPALLPVLSLALAQTVIPFWHTAGPPGDRVLEEAIRSFNAGQNAYRLEARYVGDYREAGVKLLSALRAGGAPALFHAELSFLPRLAQEGVALPLDPYLQNLPQDLHPEALRAAQVKGKTYGLPLGLSVPALYYNKDAFRAKGLRAPRTWAEVEEAAAKLTSRTAKGLVVSTDIWSFNAVVMSLGGSLVKDGLPAFTSKEVVEALEMLYRMVQRGHAQARNLAEASFAVADFLRTKAFMGLAPTTALPVVLSQTSLPFGVGMAPLPRREGGAVPLSGAALVVLKGASPEGARGAVAFWLHFLEPRRQAAWVRTTWYLPLRRAAEAELKDFLQDPERQAVFAQGEVARPWSQDPELVVWYGYLEEALEKSLKQGVRPREALEEAQKRALAAEKR